MTGRWMFSLPILAALVVPATSWAQAPVAKGPLDGYESTLAQNGKKYADDLHGSGSSGLAENAALCYWQAFDVMPKPSDKQKSTLDEAIDGHRPVDAKLVEMAERVGPALRQLHRGAKIPRCAWGLDYDLGIAVPLPHLSQARRLAKLACLRARVHFEKGRPAEAIDDLAAAMTLGRHVGADGLLVVVLVDYAIERMAINLAARYLPTLNPKDVAALAKRLENLPSSITMQEAMLAEKEIFGGGVVRDLSKPEGKKQLLQLAEDEGDPGLKALAELSPEEFAKAAKDFLGVYDKLAELMSLPPEAAEEAERKLFSEEEMPGPAGSLARMLAPAVSAARHAEARCQTLLAMLKAGIALQKRGKAALDEKEHQDPFGKGPFQYVPVDGGYQLRSKLTEAPGGGDPISLTFGAPQPK